MKTTGKKAGVAVVCALMASGCATGPNGQRQGLNETLKSTFASDDPCSNNARNIGVAAGTVIGGVLGKSMGDGKTGSILAGAAVGALLGGFIGSDMDRRRCDLSKVAKAHDLDIQMTDITFSAPVQANSNASTPIAQNNGKNLSATPNATKASEAVGMSLTVFDRGNQFAPGSARPSQNTLKAFEAIAAQYAAVPSGSDPNALQVAKERNRKMRLLLIGHTDDTGPSQLNADLSEERARTIAKVFAQHGFATGQIYYQGAGEVFPIADNRTEDGRARNRRVEIVDLSDDATFEAFLASRQPNVAHYRPVPSPSLSAQAASTPAQRRSSGKPSIITPTTGSKSAGSDVRSGSTSNTSQVKAPSSSAQKNVPLGKAPLDRSTPSNTDHSTPDSVTSNAGSAGKPAEIATTAGWQNLDLGGKPVAGAYKSVDIGNPMRVSGFSIFSTAYASDKNSVGSCATDRPRISNQVKSLESGQSLKTSDYLPGTASSSWSGKVNGHLVGLVGVAVLRDGVRPASRPTLYIWKNWEEGSKAKPLLKTTADVNAYQGDKALLYRVFPADGPVRCVDMVIPVTAPSTAPESTLVYEHAKAMYQADYSPTIAR